VIVAAGEVEIEQDGATVSGGPGFVAHFDPKERHEVRAVSDARLILVLAPWPGEGHPSQR
jgi:quercetin dioxygenase-like cupin family protein